MHDLSSRHNRNLHDSILHANIFNIFSIHLTLCSRSCLSSLANTWKESCYWHTVQGKLSFFFYGYIRLGWICIMYTQYFHVMFMFICLITLSMHQQLILVLVLNILQRLLVAGKQLSIRHASLICLHRFVVLELERGVNQMIFLCSCYFSPLLLKFVESLSYTELRICLKIAGEWFDVSTILYYSKQVLLCFFVLSNQIKHS